MNLHNRINALVFLGDYIRENIYSNEFQTIIEQAYVRNNWFTKEFTELSLSHICNHYLNREKLEKWINRYDFSSLKRQKTIGLTLAGNIPMVGFHDVICSFISNHKSMIKTSHKDSILLPFLMKKLSDEFPASQQYFNFCEQLRNFEAIIATGSNTSAAYFNYYFGKYPNIIRKNRNSIGILTGKETEEQLVLLSNDIFTYFGLGCRNISKLFVPSNYHFDYFFNAIQSYQYFDNHFRYSNNYYYYKSIYLLNQYQIHDNDFILLKEDEGLNSPISVLFYQYYTDKDNLKLLIDNHQDEIQIIVSEDKNIKNSIDFGKTQFPELWDYADGIDTIQFLLNLN